jgi:hypothetical protein
VLQAFLKTFLIDSGYKTPIKNIDELYASGIKLAYSQDSNSIFENGHETEVSKLSRNLVKCASYDTCAEWAMYHTNVSVLISDIMAEINYAVGDFLSKNSEHLVCRLNDGVVFSSRITLIMYHGDPLMRRVNELIYRVVEAGIYTYWSSMRIYSLNLKARKIAIVHPLDGYYSFNLYHIQPAFYLLLMGWCLSTFCFIVEVLYKCVLVQTT